MDGYFAGLKYGADCIPKMLIVLKRMQVLHRQFVAVYRERPDHVSVPDRFPYNTATCS
jgi:hypothetical protein